MANETLVTVVGNLTADPELRFTPAGAAVANFTVASTPRTFDRAAGEWRDGETLFLRCNIWRQAAENVVETLIRGSRVIVQGRLKQRSFETREGENRTVVELDVDDIGPSLRHAKAAVTKTPSDRPASSPAPSSPSSPSSPSTPSSPASPPAEADPWASAAPAGAAPASAGSRYDDEPPF